MNREKKAVLGIPSHISRKGWGGVARILPRVGLQNGKNFRNMFIDYQYISPKITEIVLTMLTLPFARMNAQPKR